MQAYSARCARTGLGARALLLAVAAGCRSVEATSTPLALAGLAVLAAPAASLRVACLGDSITRGDTKHEPKKEQDKDKFERGNWPRYVSQDSDAVEAKNFGQSGVMVLRGKKQYTDTDIYQEVVAWAPDVAIIWLGINDAKEKDNGKFKRKQFIDDYRDMLKQMTSDIDGLDAIYIIKQYPIVDDCCDIKLPFVNEDLPLAIEEVVDKGAMRGVPVTMIDLDWNARTGCLDGVDEDDQSSDCLKYYDSDGVHTSQKGSRLVAESVLLALFPPSPRPTSRPSRLPTRMPTRKPTLKPSLEPTRASRRANQISPSTSTPST